MTKEKSLKCDPNDGRRQLISSVPSEQNRAFFPDSGRYHGLHSHGAFHRLLFWKKDKAGDILTKEDVKENEGTADEGKTEKVAVAEVLSLVLTAPLRIVSPISRIFLLSNAREQPIDVAPCDGTMRFASKTFEDIIAPTPAPRGFWPSLYHHFMVNFGSMLVTESFHWIANVGAFLWMLLPTSWVIMLCEKVTGYFRRWTAFSNQFRLPRRFRDPFKGWREYLLTDLSKLDGTGTRQYKYAFGAAFAGFAYQSQQTFNRRRRRAKYHRD